MSDSGDPRALRAPAPASGAGGQQYRERLTPPWWGWLLAAFWASTLGIAYGYAISTLVGVLVGLVLFGVAVVAMVRWSVVVVVDSNGLRAGRATLPASAIGNTTALDAATARAKRGTGADRRAFVLLRGWIRPAVVVDVDDPADPTPYWYVSTRRPERLAAAIAGVTGSSGRAPAPEGRNG